MARIIVERTTHTDDWHDAIAELNDALEARGLGARVSAGSDRCTVELENMRDMLATFAFLEARHDIEILIG